VSSGRSLFSGNSNLGNLPKLTVGGGGGGGFSLRQTPETRLNPILKTKIATKKIPPNFKILLVQ